MRISKAFELAWNILAHSKLRSWLTIIGIVIGIGAVVSIVSVSQGAQADLESRFGDMGADLITVSPGFSQASGFRRPPGDWDTSSLNDDQDPLTNKDVLAIKSLSNIKAVMGKVSAKGEVKYLGESGDVSITGVDTEEWKSINTNEIEYGRDLASSDLYSAVIGYRIANEFFDDEIQINRQITIEGKIFKVVGIYAEGEDDNAIVIPIGATYILEDVEEDEYDSITVKVKDEEIVNETQAAIEDKLMLSRGILNEEDKDFSVSANISLQNTMASTMQTMSIFLGAIAAISLIVGAVGISNTMFTSVLEKTKEIGIMKATGAKNRDILSIFLINSAMIGFVGGIGGVIVGVMGSGYISILASGSSTTSGPGGGFSRMFSSTSISL